MNSNNNFIITIEELELELQWEKKKLNEVFPYDPSKEISENVFGKESHSVLKFFALLCVLFLSAISLAFIPFDSLIININSVDSNLMIFCIYVLNSLYFYWLVTVLKKRYKINIEKKISRYRPISFIRSLKNSDFVFLIIELAFYVVYQSKISPDENSIYSEPVKYLLDYAKSVNTDQPFQSELIAVILMFIVLIVLTGFLVISIYQIWIKSPEKNRKNLIKLLQNKITIKSTPVKVNDETSEEITIESESDSDSDSEFKCIVSTITADTNLTTLWKLIYPLYLLRSYFFIILGSFFFYIGLSFFDNYLNNPEYKSVSYVELFSLIVILISLMFLMGSFYVVKKHVFTPLWNYYRMKKFIVKKIKERKNLLIDHLKQANPSLTEIYDFLYLTDCLEKNKRAFILPIDKPIFSLVLLIPILSHFLTILSRFLI